MRVEGLRIILNAFDRPVKLNMICDTVPQDTLAQLKARVAPPEEANPDEPTLEDLFKALEVSSIFELVGKVLKLDPQVALGALCDDFYVRLVSDQRLLPFFANVSMGRMRNLQKECLMEALGGPKNYKGMDLKTAHAHFKIDDDVYDAVIAHLFASVLHFIPAPPKAVVVALVGLTEALRGAVCNTSIDQDMEVTSQEDGENVTVMDKSKAAPYFSGSLWSTGLFKRRGKDDIHPALAAPKKYKGGFCCPFMSSDPEPVPNSDDKIYEDTEKQESSACTI
jgi:hemoglobin